MMSQAIQDRYLESGGSSCHDPYSWVWTAPRAVRVSVGVDSNRPCEIGAQGCDRQPESLSSAAEAFASIKAVCGLKSKQHASSDQVGEFDNEACVEAESRAALESLLITIDHSEVPRGPVCTRDDPRCESLPPVPASIQPPAAPTASGLTKSQRPLEGAISNTRQIDMDSNLLDGVRRRVVRPPITG